VEAGDDDDLFRLDEVKDDVGEMAQKRAPDVLMNQGVLLGHALDTGEASVDRAEERGAEAFGSGLVVIVAGNDLRLGLGPNKDRHRTDRRWIARLTCSSIGAAAGSVPGGLVYHVAQRLAPRETARVVKQDRELALVEVGGVVGGHVRGEQHVGQRPERVLAG
jgi:hypothetical protein